MIDKYKNEDYSDYSEIWYICNILYWFVLFCFVFLYIFDKIKEIALKIPRNKWINMYTWFILS